MIISTRNFSQLSYSKEGSGPVVALIHGFPESKGLWAEVSPILAGSFTVLAIDVPGAGESGPPAEVSMESLAEALNEVLEHEEIEQAVVVGHSMGGYIALAFAEKYPQKVRGLSLVHSIASADNEEKKETRKKSADLIRKGGKEPFIKQMIPNLFSPEFREQHPSVIERQVKRGMELAAESMIAFTEAMMHRPDRTSVLKNAAFPVQFIIGEDDALIPTKTALQQTSLATRNFVSLYRDTGHMSMIEHAVGLAKDLGEFTSYCFNNRNIEQSA
jgi:pimeloyl-ACP methyl ester carboxylesterase